MSSASTIIPLPQVNLPFGTAAVLFIAYSLYFLSTFGAREKNLPPGPPTVPILGNLTIVPKFMLHLKFAEWSKEYGDVFSLKVLNKTMIVLSSPTAVRELIDKRATSSGNRPKSILADMITPHNMNLGTGRFPNETWSALRKASMQLLNSQNMRKHRDFNRAESVQLMIDLMRDPEDWFHLAGRTILSFSLGITWGCRSPLIKSKEVKEFLHVHPRFINALEFGRLPPVDLFPILTIVPERFAAWKREVNEIRRLHDTMYDDLLRRVEARIERGDSTPGFMEEAIKHANEWGLNKRELLMYLGGVLLEGADTSSATLQVLVLILVTFPDKVKKAQAELDRVVGRDRLPTWDDLDNLPYTTAFMEETMRFRPVGPLGLPHEMVKDEVIDGKLYPKDAVIFYNTWGMFHDERYFDQPDEFIPERFLNSQFGVKPAIKDDSARRPNMLFGGGRRVCPGITFARNNLEINTCNLLWGFDFLPALDASGKEVFPDINGFTSGITATPLPFKCRIKVRSAHHAELIKQEFASVAEVLTPYELELTPEEKKFNATYRDL